MKLALAFQGKYQYHSVIVLIHNALTLYLASSRVLTLITHSSEVSYFWRYQGLLYVIQVRVASVNPNRAIGARQMTYSHLYRKFE